MKSLLVILFTLGFSEIQSQSIYLISYAKEINQ